MKMKRLDFSGHVLAAICEGESLEKVFSCLCGTITILRGAEHWH